MNSKKAVPFSVAWLLLIGCMPLRGDTAQVDVAQATAKLAGLEVTGLDGKKQSIKDLVKDGPIFLYFAKRTCGSNPRAIPLMKRVYAPHADKVRMFAVVDTDAPDFKDWAKEYGVKNMKAALDPDLTLVHAFGFKHSQDVVVIGKDMQVKSIIVGFGRDALKELAAQLTEASGVKVPNLNLDDAPSGKAFG